MKAKKRRQSRLARIGSRSRVVALGVIVIAVVAVVGTIWKFAGHASTTPTASVSYPDDGIVDQTSLDAIEAAADRADTDTTSGTTIDGTNLVAVPDPQSSQTTPWYYYPGKFCNSSPYFGNHLCIGTDNMDNGTPARQWAYNSARLVTFVWDHNFTSIDGFSGRAPTGYLRFTNHPDKCLDVPRRTNIPVVYDCSSGAYGIIWAVAGDGGNPLKHLYFINRRLSHDTHSAIVLSSEVLTRYRYRVHTLGQEGWFQRTNVCNPQFFSQTGVSCPY